MEKKILESRHSVRAYTTDRISDEIRKIIDEKINSYNSEGNLKISIVYDEPESFGKSILAHYGKFSNVANYFCLIAEKSSADVEERLGYYGEKLVLLVQELGLNTCWVGLTFKKGKIPVKLNKGDKIFAVIAVGYGENQGVEHKSKTPEKVAPDFDTAPEWYREGVKCALLAPTAINQQKFNFKYLGDNKVKATHGVGFFTKMDLGIAKCHFEIGARPIEVDWS